MKNSRFPVKIAIIRGPSLNKFEIQSLEPLLNKYEMVAISSTIPIHNLSDIKIPIIKLPCLGQFFSKIPGGINLLYRLEGDTQRLLGLQNYLKEGFDIVHTAETASYYSLQAIRAKEKKLIKKVVVTVWENIPFLGEEIPRRKALKSEVRKKADCFLAVTNTAKQALILEGVPKEKIFTVPMGVDTKIFKPRKRDDKLLSKFNIRSSDTVILSVGRMVKEKGFYDLLYAAKELHDDTSVKKVDWKMLLIGEGPEKEKLQKLQKTLGLEKKVIFLKNQDYAEMPKIFSSSDIFVLASHSVKTWQEQFGMVLIEAMSSGLPIISTQSGAIQEVVGDAGVLVPPADHKSLYIQIKNLLLNPSKRKNLSVLARQRALLLFDSQTVAQQIEAIFKKVLSQKS